MRSSPWKLLPLPSLLVREMWGGKKVRMVGKPEEMMMMITTQKQTTPIAECSLTVRLQAVGDSVTEDEVVCEIETDKVRNGKSFSLEPICLCLLETPWILCSPQTSVQVPAPAAGVIEELLVPDGGKVEGGTPLFKLRKGGEALSINFFLLLCFCTTALS